jgi:hypothetical protein
VTPLLLLTYPFSSFSPSSSSSFCSSHLLLLPSPSSSILPLFLSRDPSSTILIQRVFRGYLGRIAASHAAEKKLVFLNLLHIAFVYKKYFVGNVQDVNILRFMKSFVTCITDVIVKHKQQSLFVFKLMVVIIKDKRNILRLRPRSRSGADGRRLDSDR